MSDKCSSIDQTCILSGVRAKTGTALILYCDMGEHSSALYLELEEYDAAARHLASAHRIYTMRDIQKNAYDASYGLKLIYEKTGGSPDDFQAWLEALLSSPELP